MHPIVIKAAGKEAFFWAGIVLLAIFCQASTRPDYQPLDGHLPILFANLLQAARGFVGSGLCVLAAVLLGRRLLKSIQPDLDSLVGWVLAGAAGVVVLTLSTTLVVLLQIAYPACLISLLVFGIWIGRNSLGPLLERALGLLRGLAKADASIQVLITWMGFFLAYAFLCTLGNPYCSDTLAYHLTIPQDILREHGIHYHYFFYQAGLSWGWQVFSLLAYAVGGARACTTLVAWSVLALALLFYGVVRQDFSRLTGLLFIAIAGFLWYWLVGENDRTGNDVPLLFFQCSALAVVMGRSVMDTRSRAILLGAFLGMALAIKITSMPGFFILTAIFFQRLPAAERPMALVRSGLLLLPQALLWPLYDFWKSGSPLPQMLLALRMHGPALPQLQDTISYDGLVTNWQQWNFCCPVIMIPVAMVGLGSIPVILFLREKRGVEWTVFLLAYAVLHWLILLVASPLCVFYARYNLISFVCIGLVGAIGWSALFESTGKALKKWGPLVFICFLLTLCAVANLKSNIKIHLKDFLCAPGARTSHVDCFNFVSTQLPQGAVLAGPALETYYTHRPYLQMQGISQEQIDLRQPPEALLAALKRRGVTYLHFSSEYDLQPMNVELAESWMTNYNRIANLPDVEPIYVDHCARYDYMSAHIVRDSLYRIGHESK